MSDDKKTVLEAAEEADKNNRDKPETDVVAKPVIEEEDLIAKRAAAKAAKDPYEEIDVLDIPDDAGAKWGYPWDDKRLVAALDLVGRLRKGDKLQKDRCETDYTSSVLDVTVPKHMAGFVKVQFKAGQIYRLPSSVWGQVRAKEADLKKHLKTVTDRNKFKRLKNERYRD